MTLSALIRKRDTGNLATAIPAIFATHPKGEAATVARIATVAVATPQEAKTAPKAKVGAGDTATASRWWLIHYPDRYPVEVACCPEATHADILERHPDALAAEPFEPSTPEPERACSTCGHRPPRWVASQLAPCGNPVAAGLSDLPGVIRYHPHQGSDCPAWLATLDGDLGQRIKAMAQRWGYSPAKLVQALDAARQDPNNWRRMVEADEHEALL